MMKYTLFFLLLSFVLLPAKAQLLEEKIAAEVCSCLGEADTMEQLEERLDNCFPDAMITSLKNANQEEKKLLGSVEGMRKLSDKAQEMLPSVCPEVRRLVLTYRKELYYRDSESPKAMRHYKAGNKLLQEEKYDKALKKFMKAVKADPEFVYAIDHIAICYRRMEDFDKAISYYNQSLSIYPEGELALLNMAVIYSILTDYDKALEYYEYLQFLYPDNPEGYFGIARMAIIREEYPRALDNVFIAHKLYTLQESPYLQDSVRLIEELYAKLKRLDNTDLFFAKAEEHEVKVNLEQ